MCCTSCCSYAVGAPQEKKDHLSPIFYRRSPNVPSC
uniref:Uncharacterized protein n=1 Tax=Arundo donax TaxID=35708 RepID=A0A0A9GQV6_ARUDO